MRKARFLAETQRHKILENSGVSVLQGVNLITVDIQPEYQEYFGWQAQSFGYMINKNHEQLNSLTFLFNGLTLGFPAKKNIGGG